MQLPVGTTGNYRVVLEWLGRVFSVIAALSVIGVFSVIREPFEDTLEGWALISMQPVHISYTNIWLFYEIQHRHERNIQEKATKARKSNG